MMNSVATRSIFIENVYFCVFCDVELPVQVWVLMRAVMIDVSQCLYMC